MNTKEKTIFKHLMAQYKHQYDLNGYNRENYNTDLEYYLGYRNPSNYPLAYNESFNKILPIIYSLLSRFMSQMYQGGNIVSVKPRKKKDVQNQKAVEAVLNFQMESLNSIDMQGGSYLTMMKWFFNALTFGKGIAKCYWRKEERISPKRMLIQAPSFDNFGRFQGYDPIDYISEEMQTTYDGPYVEILHNKLCIPHPEYKSIQQMPAFFIVYARTMDYIKRKVDKGEYDRRNFREMGWESSGQGGVYAKDSDEAFMHGLGIEGGLSMAEIDNPLQTKNVDIIEAYTRLILKDEPYEVGSGIKIKGMEEEAIIHIGNYKTILSIQKNPYGIRPFFDIGCYMQPEMYWDVGLVRLTKGIQEQYNTLANLRMQNAMMLVNSMLRVDPDSDIDPQALIWKPFGIVPALQGEVEPLVIPDYNSNIFAEQESFYESTIQDLMGMYDYSMGQTPKRQERVGVVYGIQAMGEARAKLMLMSMDYLGIRPLLKYMMLLNTFHLPSGFEYRISDRDQHSFGNIFGNDIHADFDFAARYTSMEPALGKQARADRLVQLAGMWQQNPWINQYQMSKVIMDLMDIYESDSLLKTPQMMQQEMQQQMQSQMMMEAQKKKFETDGKLQIGGQDIQGEMAINEQEFGHNLVLESIKANAAEEKVKTAKAAHK
uniref:Portal protein n=1 Tax=viral metagenome TaxID=1070528 RepID=A0A6H1ZHM6_9ZZZZ